MLRWINYLRTHLILKKKSFSQRMFASKNEGYVRFVILCAARSGSTWLHTLLNSHPHIISKGEIQTDDLSKDVFHSYPTGIHAVGLKVFYANEDSPPSSVFEKILKVPEIRIIHLVRTDVLAQYTSLQLARQSREWSKLNSGKTLEKVRIDPQVLEAYQAAQLNIQEQIGTIFKNHKVLRITYEELQSNMHQTLKTVQEFLGVMPRKLFSLLKKQSIGPLARQIENSEDFEKLLK